MNEREPVESSDVADVVNVAGTAAQRERLVAALRDPRVDLAQRLAAGRELAVAGDPRIRPDEPDVVGVAAGDAVLGDPPRTEHVNVFSIARYPLTNREYALFVADTGHPTPPSWRGGDVPPELANHPVETVSWADAVAYCRWLTRRTGRIYRLPDEREWERAARGTNARAWPWEGDGAEANERANCAETGLGSTTPIGAFPLGDTPEGLGDMAGNVREWTNTWRDAGRVQRGGSYRDLLAHASTSYVGTSDLRGVGFRLVRSLTGR